MTQNDEIKTRALEMIREANEREKENSILPRFRLSRIFSVIFVAILVYKLFTFEYQGYFELLGLCFGFFNLFLISCWLRQEEIESDAGD